MVARRVVCKLMISVGTALVAAGAAAQTETVTKTWTVTLPSGDGLTNNAPVTLSDGNYQLRGWIQDVDSRQLAVGGHPDPDHVDGDDAAHIAAGQALVTDAGGAYVGKGDLDLRGAVVAADSAEAWSVVYIGRYAFCKVYEAPFDICILPTTLLGMGDATFLSCGSTSGFTTFRLEAPDMAGRLPNNTFLANRNLTKVTLRIPRVDAISCYWKRGTFDNFLAETDVSDWDLSSLQSFYRKREDEGYLFRWSKFHGTMRVPALKWLNARTFESCPNMNALEAGRNGTLEYVGQGAVTACPALGSLVLGGAAAGWTVAANAFNAVNLTNVTFLTTAPAYEEGDTVIFGTDATPARQIAFHIPLRGTRGWDANWGRMVRAARTPTDAERAAFAEKFGAYAAEGLVGLVAPGIFRTAREQWLVCGRSSILRHAVKVSVLDPRFTGDAVAVSPAPDADGCYAAGTRVTLTATADAAKGRFVRWRGTVGEAEEGVSSLTLVVDRDLDLTAQFAHDWTLTPADPEAGFADNAIGYISNHVWKIRVMVANAARGTLRYGANGTTADNQGSAWTDFGAGMLDLNGRIFAREADGTEREWTMEGYCGPWSFMGPGSDRGETIPPERYPRAFILREDLPVHPGQAFRYRASKPDSGVYPTNFVFECAAFRDNFGADALCGHAWNAGRLRLPGLTSVPYASSCKLAGVDVSDWRLDGLTNLNGLVQTAYTFYGLFANGGSFTGTLHLPALATVQSNGCFMAAQMEAVELGANTVVTAIGAKAFAGCSSLARIRLRAGADLAVDADAFTGTTKLKILDFTFEAPKDPAAVDNMLAGTTEEIAVSADPPVIYASRALGWTGAKIANIQPPTDAERAARPAWVPDNGLCLGVWQTAAGARKAWVVHRPSPDDPRGTCLFFR